MADLDELKHDLESEMRYQINNLRFDLEQMIGHSLEGVEGVDSLLNGLLADKKKGKGKSPDTGRATKSPQNVRTPRELVDVCKAFFPLAVDLAATSEDHVLPEFITPEEDTLKQDWAAITGPGRWGFCNPPFMKMGEIWAPKFIHEVSRGARFITLTLASLENNWYTEFFHGRTCEVRVLKGRLRFPGYSQGASKGHMLTIWDGQPFRAPWPWDWRRDYDQLQERGYI